ncbi:MAG: hypothetical protein K2W88_15060 [Pararheinheimera sp.]|nr:hypothetical protein [Rheinheimera sp.]
MIKEVYRAMLENQKAQTELLEAIWKDAQPVRVQEALDLFRHIYEENKTLKAELLAMKERPTGDTILLMRNAALDSDLARANKRLEAWTAVGRSITAVYDGIDSLKKVPSKPARELLEIGFTFSLDKILKETAELYRAQQGQKPAKPAGASA